MQLLRSKYCLFTETCIGDTQNLLNSVTQPYLYSNETILALPAGFCIITIMGTGTPVLVY